MIYLDYSATTKTSKEVLDTFVKVSTDFIGNPNSLHKLGVESKKLIDASTEQIANIMGVKKDEIIYTSGASESNNTVLKGVALRYQKRGKHIITTQFEHSSIYGPISYLQTLGFDVDFVETDQDGIVKIDSLKKLLREDTILVSISAVNSEIGIIEPINQLGKYVHEHSNAFFHSDFTQLVGKDYFKTDDIDLISFSAHKFFGIKGIGILVKKSNVDLIPLIHGGKSTTIYRSGTPAVALIASTAKALRLSHESLKFKDHVKNLNTYLKSELEKIDDVYVNSNDKCIPQIVNFSVLNVKPESMLHALEEDEIYISTKTACASDKSYSKAVYALTNDMDRALTSMRVSLSYITTKEEVDAFLVSLKKNIAKLRLKDVKNS